MVQYESSKSPSIVPLQTGKSVAIQIESRGRIELAVKSMPYLLGPGLSPERRR